MAVFLAAGVELSHRYAPSDLRATAQGIFQVCSTCLAGGIGNVVGGWAFHAYGGRALYQITALVGVLILGLWGVPAASGILGDGLHEGEDSGEQKPLLAKAAKVEGDAAHHAANSVET